MAWLKCNKTKLANNLRSANSYYTSLEKIVNELARLDMYEKTFTGKKTDDSGNWTSFWHSWFTKNRNYQDAADKIHEEAVWMQQNILKPFKVYCDSLNSISNMITNFENQEISLANKFKVFADGGRFQLDANGDGTSANFVIDTVQGTEIMYYSYKDPDGNWNNITIPEMTNAFYTEIGMNQAQIITMGLLDKAAGGTGYLTPDEISEIVAGTNSFVTDFLPLGAFGVASSSDIQAVNSALEIETSEVETLKIKLEEPGIADVMSVVNGSVGVGLAFIGAYTLTDGFSTEIDKITTTTKPTTAPPTTPTTTPPTTPTTTGDVETITTQPVTQPQTQPQTQPNTQPATQPNTQPVTEVETEPITQPETKPTTIEEDDRLIQPEDDEIPTSPEVPTISPEDLDDMAKDEFFDKYGIEDLDNRRRQEAEEYERLYNMENRDELINKFKEMGYGDAEAVAAANNRDIGLAAFALGSQNKELTDIANRFAEEYGLTDKFNTSFDDKPDFTDLYDGDAQASLATPYRSDAVMEAKESVTTAKEAYTQSVASANSSIDKATKAKEEMNKVRASIEAKSGTDTSKWSDEDIEAYNKATENYNTAVTKANEDAAAAEAAKNAYNTAKDNLAKAEDDYYNNIKSGIQQQNGIVNGGSSPSANNQTDVGVTTDPNALPTDTSNSSNSSIPSNTGNLSNNISEPSTSSEAETIPDQDLLDAFLNL